jgi:hypothetical protein
MGFINIGVHIMQKDNLTHLLKGCVLVKELISNDKRFRTWLEISLQIQVDPSFTLVKGRLVMDWDENFLPEHKKKICEKSEAKFKVRQNSFLIEDIENGFDPSYEWVGEFKYINSIDDLFSYLAKNNLNLDDFELPTWDNDYPL